MFFLIDYENVYSWGLEGTEYLSSEDTVILFYSDSVDKIVEYRINDIFKSQCEFELFKVKNKRKNALDFCIASKVAEILTNNANEFIAIVSNDKDYLSVLDYWKERINNNQLIRCSNILKGFALRPTDDERSVEARKAISLHSLSIEVQKLRLKNEYISFIRRNLEISEMKIVEQFANVLILKPNQKELYLACLKSFGLKEGLVLYRKIKEEHLVK